MKNTAYMNLVEFDRMDGQTDRTIATIRANRFGKNAVIEWIGDQIETASTPEKFDTVAKAWEFLNAIRGMNTYLQPTDDHPKEYRPNFV